MSTQQTQVDLKIGAVLTRQELNARYGGGIQGGILTLAGGKPMFLFSDPTAEVQYGYNYDGWVTETEAIFDSSKMLHTDAWDPGERELFPVKS